MSLPRGVLAICFAASACATATPGGSGDDIIEVDGRVDAPGTIDAPPGTIDAPPGAIDARVDAPITPIDAPTTQTITLSQSSSSAITSPNTVTCNSALGNAENSFYRVFRLSDFGVNTNFTATRVDFAVEQATAANLVSQTVQVRLYTMTGTVPQVPLFTAIAGQVVSVPDSASLTVMQVPLSPPGVAPAGTTLVAEIFVPNGQANGDFFFPGSNASAETGPSYIRAPDCGVTAPATYTSIAHPEVHLIMTVTGTY